MNDPTGDQDMRLDPDPPERTEDKVFTVKEYVDQLVILLQERPHLADLPLVHSEYDEPYAVTGVDLYHMAFVITEDDFDTDLLENGNVGLDYEVRHQFVQLDFDTVGWPHTPKRNSQT